MKAIGIIDFQKTSGKVLLKKLSFPKFRGKVHYQWKAGVRTELQNALDYKGFRRLPASVFFSQEMVVQGLVHWGFENVQGWMSPSMWVTSPVQLTLTVKIFFLRSSWNFPCYNL